MDIHFTRLHILKSRQFEARPSASSRYATICEARGMAVTTRAVANQSIDKTAKNKINGGLSTLMWKNL